MIRINITSVFVDDQAKALDFYTEKLGFIKKHDVPTGGARWLTVVSPPIPTVSNCCWNRTATPRRSRSSRR